MNEYAPTEQVDDGPETERGVVAELFADEVNSAFDAGEWQGPGPAENPADEGAQWSGISQEDWHQTQNAIHAIAELVAQHDAADEWGDEDEGEFTLDPFGDNFDGQLGQLLEARDEYLLEQLWPIVGPLFEEQQSRAAETAEGMASSILDREAGRIGTFDRELARDLADSIFAKLAAEHPDAEPSALARHALQEAAARVRGSRQGGRARPRRAASSVTHDDDTENDVIRRLFGAES